MRASEEYQYPDVIPAFNNATGLAFKRNLDDDVINKLIDIADELLSKGFHNVWYYYSQSEEPIFVIEIPMVEGIKEHGWIIISMYKNRVSNNIVLIVNSDGFKPLDVNTAGKVIEYYDSVLNNISENKAKMIKSILDNAKIKVNNVDVLKKVIDILEEEYAFNGFSPEDYDDETVQFAFDVLRKIDSGLDNVLKVLLPLSDRDFDFLVKEYGF